jgi:ribosome maturation factor RimP
MKGLKDRLEKLIKDAAEALGYEIVDWEYIAGRSAVLRVYITKADGEIGIGDCKRFNEYLGAMLDIEDPIESSYTLEISSPGVNRELKKDSDYKLALGKWIIISVKEPVCGSREVKGYLKEIDDQSLTIEIDGSLHKIMKELILKARMDTPLFNKR